jgi:hypothetical protein
MTDELLIRKDLEGDGCDLIEALSRNLSGRPEEITRNLSQDTGGVPADIRTEHPQNMSVERYGHTNPLHTKRCRV